MQQQEQKQTEQTEELSFLDVWLVIKRYSRQIILVAIFAALAASIVIFLVIKPKWEASAVLQVAQVDGKLVEPISQVVSRIKHDSFRSALFEQIKINDNKNIKKIKRLYKESLSVNKPKDADIVDISLKGYSPEQAQLLLEDSVVYLQKEHSKLMDASIIRIQGEVKNTARDIQDLKTESEYLKRQLEAKRDWNSYNATLGAVVMQNKTDALRALAQKKLELDEKLSPSLTFTTKVIGAISVSEEPAFPLQNVFQQLSIVLLGVLLGLFSGIVYALLANSVRKV